MKIRPYHLIDKSKIKPRKPKAIWKEKRQRNSKPRSVSILEYLVLSHIKRNY